MSASHLTRRGLLQVGSASFLGLSLPQLLRAQEVGLAAKNNDLSVILLFMWGGMPHQDMWDLKPGAPDDIRGPYQPIETNVPGIQIGELMPQCAKIADQYTLVRSVTHTEVEHPRAAHYMMTGNQIIRGSEWPNMGATIDKFGGPTGQLNSVVVGPRLIDQPITPQGQDGGFLGNLHAPFRIADPLQPLDKIARLNPPAGLAETRSAQRRRLYDLVRGIEQPVDTNETQALEASYEKAFSIVNSPAARQAFDLSKEKDETRERYGNHLFGQGALMARRLVEAGVKFIQVNWREHPINNNGFDNHSDNFEKLEKTQGPEVDQTYSALISDLQQRGMLDRTLVSMTGEFGRTPKINNSKGRDHWPHCFSYLITGGGIPGGRVIGSSDREAGLPATNPVTPENTLASVFDMLDLDLDQLHKLRVLDDVHGIPGLFG